MLWHAVGTQIDDPLHTSTRGPSVIATTTQHFAAILLATATLSLATAWAQETAGPTPELPQLLATITALPPPPADPEAFGANAIQQAAEGAGFVAIAVDDVPTGDAMASARALRTAKRRYNASIGLLGKAIATGAYDTPAGAANRADLLRQIGAAADASAVAIEDTLVGNGVTGDLGGLADTADAILRLADAFARAPAN